MNAVQVPACIACGAKTQVFIDKIWDDRYGCPGVFSIMRCPDCHQMVTAPPLTEADLPALAIDDTKAGQKTVMPAAEFKVDADAILAFLKKHIDLEGKENLHK